MTATLQAGIKEYLFKKSMVLPDARQTKNLFFDRFNFVAFFQAKAIAAKGSLTAIDPGKTSLTLGHQFDFDPAALTFIKRLEGFNGVSQRLFLGEYFCRVYTTSQGHFD